MRSTTKALSLACSLVCLASAASTRAQERGLRLHGQLAVGIAGQVDTVEKDRADDPIFTNPPGVNSDPEWAPIGLETSLGGALEAAYFVDKFLVAAQLGYHAMQWSYAYQPVDRIDSLLRLGVRLPLFSGKAEVHITGMFGPSWFRWRGMGPSNELSLTVGGSAAVVYAPIAPLAVRVELSPLWHLYDTQSREWGTLAHTVRQVRLTFGLSWNAWGSSSPRQPNTQHKGAN